MQDVQALFRDRLPRRPYCSNDKTARFVRPAAVALGHSYIQYNQPALAGWLVFDLDYDYLTARQRWAWPNLPPPTIAVVNPENHHAHLYYALEAPVCTSEAGRDGPLRYAAAIEAAYTLALGADPGFAGLLGKNPLHASWLLETHARLYSLAWLADHVDLPRRPPVREAAGLGRNCTLFDELRTWAYQWVRQYKRNGARAEQWRAALEGQAAALNQFSSPLPESEVRATARSVAGWTWRKFSDANFATVQAARGRRGGLAKGAANEDKRASARLMAAAGQSGRAIAAELGVNQSTVARWLAE